MPATEKEIDESNPANSFLTTLAALEFGNLVPEASEKLAKLVSRVVTTGKKGKITISLEIAPGKGNSGQVKIESEITIKEPKPEKGESIFFGTVQGQLLRRDPRQKELDFSGDLPKPVSFPAASGQ